ncbi:hypothetical protein [Pseudomonas syringae group genomosp. 3]|uniref:hypothetical protein n=1 Tax=Pseudomonas syringae group genomosp. 3 TaxID=251701 RepID=UPI000EFE3F1A|nr:hypothetical protein [Pseudomonas syringae group genomosp. 3]QQN26306.1 hypothetical protein JHZ65_22070 [Pseudomonas syringae pv. maculicola]
MLPELCRELFDKDGNPLQLSIAKREFKVNEIHIVAKDLPFLIEPKTKRPYITKLSEILISEEIKTRNRALKCTVKIPEKIKKTKYELCKDLDFAYSAVEYLSTPGLAHEFSNSGFLAPIYFKPEVLNKYAMHPSYSLTLLSSTYGSITKLDEWQISFGVNASKNIIMWLGDIDELPLDEKFYLLSENVEPQFDVHSQFYNAQIENEWAQPNIESQLFKLREDTSALVEIVFSTPLYKLEGEIAETIGNLQKPIFWTDIHVANLTEALNRIFVESIDEKTVKTAINKIPPLTQTKNLKGLKLLSLLIEKLSNKESAYKIMTPFFVLNDYRGLLQHLQSEYDLIRIMKTINLRLELPEENLSHELIYTKLFQHMRKAYSDAYSIIKNFSFPTDESNREHA